MYKKLHILLCTILLTVTAITVSAQAQCYEGGLDIRGQPADTRTEAQKAAMRKLLEELHQRYPRAFILGHRDLNPGKDCPGYKDVSKEYAALQPK